MAGWGAPISASKCQAVPTKQNYPRSLLIPWSRGDLTPVSAVQIFSAPGAWPRSPDSKQDFSAQLSVGRCWCCRALCVCFGNGSDVNPDLNRNKKPVAEIPWGNQTNVQAPRSITSLCWYSISLCLGVILSAASCLWFGSLRTWNVCKYGMVEEDWKMFLNFPRTICAVDIYLNLGWISLWYDLIT